MLTKTLLVVSVAFLITGVSVFARYRLGPPSKRGPPPPRHNGGPRQWQQQQQQQNPSPQSQQQKGNQNSQQPTTGSGGEKSANNDNLIPASNGGISDHTLPEHILTSCPRAPKYTRKCRASENSDLPSCISIFFSEDFIISDGNGCTCQNRTINGVRMASKSNKATMIGKAKEMFSKGTCTGELRPHQQSIGKGNCETSSQMLESIYAEEDYTNSKGVQYKLIVTNGIPNHCYLSGQYIANPNVACEQFRAVFVPKIRPVKKTLRNSGMGAVGIAKSGAFFYNHESAESSCNAAGVTEKPNFDPCDGHADMQGRYHYHKTPTCIPGYKTCGLMGYMNDGIPVFGKCILKSASGVKTVLKSCYKKISGKNGCDTSHFELQPVGTNGCNLDAANGYTMPAAMTGANGQKFEAGSYAYFFTPEYPFIMPGLFGTKLNTWCVLDL